MSEKTKNTEEGIEAKVPVKFLEKLIEIIGPNQDDARGKMNLVYERSMMVALANLVTGSNSTLVLTPRIENNAIVGLEGEVSGDAIHKLAQMDEQQIVNAVVPHIIHVCTEASKGGLKGFLESILETLGKEALDDEDESAPAEKPADQAAA